MHSSIVVISWWSNCLGLFSIHKLIEHLPSVKIYLIQVGKPDHLKERFREYLPPEVNELFYPENESAQHWRVIEYTVRNLLKEEEGLWFFDHDTFLLDDGRIWINRMDLKFLTSKSIICIADRKHNRSFTIPAFWISPKQLPFGIPSFSPFPASVDPVADFPFFPVIDTPDLVRPEKDTLEAAVEKLSSSHSVLTYDLELDFPKHEHLGGLNIFVYKDLPLEVRGYGMQAAERFKKFYEKCPKEWRDIEDCAIFESITRILASSNS